jgi:regulator of replication initiation timing
LKDGSKMADEVSEEIVAALNKIVTTVDQSANMRKDLKKTIFQTVSNLRYLFTELKGITDEKTRLIKYNETENTKLKAELAACRQEVAKASTETSTAREEQPPGPDSRQVLPSSICAPKLFSTVVRGSIERKHRLSLRSKTNPPILLRTL